MYYDKLRNYRKIILKDRKINIALLIFELLAFLAILLATLKDIHGIFILFILLIPIILSIKCIADNNRLLNQFFNIEKNNVLNKTHQSMLYYPKVIFLRVPEVRRQPTLSPEYYGIRILDGNKNKYYYFFEEPLKYDKDSIDKIFKKFNGKIHMQCYENTSIVKTIENNPYFVHIRHGLLCE